VISKPLKVVSFTTPDGRTYRVVGVSHSGVKREAAKVDLWIQTMKREDYGPIATAIRDKIKAELW
jgi:hypothetical protein